MKLTDIIARLTSILAERGDLPVEIEGTINDVDECDEFYVRSPVHSLSVGDDGPTVFIRFVDIDTEADNG